MRAIRLRESWTIPTIVRRGLIALRTVAEAYGGPAAVSPSGNPTLKTLLAVLSTVGMRLSVEAGDQRAA